MKEKREIVYLKADRNSVCHDPKIKIQDVMSVQCADPAICAGIKIKHCIHLRKTMARKRRKKEKTNGSIFDAKCDRTDTDGLPGCGNC